MKRQRGQARSPLCWNYRVMRLLVPHVFLYLPEVVGRTVLVVFIEFAVKNREMNTGMVAAIQPKRISAMIR